VRVGINGMGRIGRTFWRVSLARPEIQVVAINDVAPADSLAYLMKYDTVRGRLPAGIDTTPTAGIVVDGEPIPTYHHAQPQDVPWCDHGVDVVLEATGRFFTNAEVARHCAARVLVSTATVDADATILIGINEDAAPGAKVVSPACCTSSAIAPILAVLRELGTVTSGAMTTVHAYDSTKSVLLDSPHWNPRMGRAAATNLIPAPFKPATIGALTGAFPELIGRIDGLHVRVPAIIGCVVEVVVGMSDPPPADVVNAALAAAAGGHFKGVLGYTEEPIVSSDIIGAPESSIVDGQFTSVTPAAAYGAPGQAAAGHGQVRVIAWYDNEWGFAHRLADVAGLLG
jgi:glyceraldehyde 3-phosphate dehydrogenase (phosphorylating)